MVPCPQVSGSATTPRSETVLCHQVSRSAGRRAQARNWYYVPAFPGEGLVFSAVGSDDPEGFPIGFTWDFGDGSPPAYTPRATHSFAAKGTYTVTLTVTDGKDETLRTRTVKIEE